MSIQKARAKRISLFLATLFTVLLFCAFAFASEPTTATGENGEPAYHITNPYADVDWAIYDQYKANLHTHSKISDGDHPLHVIVEEYYAKGYDVLAITDHNFVMENWSGVKFGAVEAERSDEIQSGADRDGRPMVCVENTNEQSTAEHMNTFWTPFKSIPNETMSGILEAVESLGGICHINHPGRYTGGSKQNDIDSIAAANKPKTIRKYVDLFMRYPCCVGMEIVNRLDHHSKSDRILWDNILKETMPEGRFVWGFAGDDAHNRRDVGYSWIVLLMPANSQTDIRTAMETGAFYAVSRVSRLDDINRRKPSGSELPGNGTDRTMYLLGQPTPGVSKIEVIGDAIRIEGVEYDTIEWIADGVIIATGNVIHLSDYAGQINSYVRAQLKSDTGIAFTQPFGVRKAEEGE